MQSSMIDGARGAEQFLPARRAWEHYGVTTVTLGRRLKDADLKSHSHSTVVHYYPTNSSCAAMCVRNSIVINIFVPPRPSTDRIDQKPVSGKATDCPPQIVITVTPDQRPGRYRTYIEAEPNPLSVSRQPFLDGARELLARGHDPWAMLVMRWVGAKDWALRGPLGVAAKLTVDEHNGVFAKWKPYSRSAVPPGNANTAMTVANGRAAKKLIPESTAEKAGERTDLDSTHHYV
jgi:hypothetical protein